jgi:hypothetical protein
MVAFHEARDVHQRRFGSRCQHIIRDDVTNFAAGKLDLVVRKPARTHKEFDPPRPLALCADLGPA